MGPPKLELLASNGVATFVMQFSITLNARHTHQTDAHMHTQTHPHGRTDTPTETTHTHTHTTCVVCVCACVCTWQSDHKIIHDHAMRWVAQLRALMHSDSQLASWQVNSPACQIAIQLSCPHTNDSCCPKSKISHERIALKLTAEAVVFVLRVEITAENRS